MEKEAIDNQAGLPSGVRVRLNIMMFLQFAIHAVWIVPVAAYLGRTLSFTTGQIAMVANSAALGCLLAESKATSWLRMW